jgi:hypothetical protein
VKPWLSLIGSIAAVVACSSTSTNPESQICEPGATRECVGVGPCSGSQVCDPGGTIWLTCECGTGGSGSFGGTGGVPDAGGGGTGGGLAGASSDGGAGEGGSINNGCDGCLAGTSCNADCENACTCGDQCECTFSCLGNCVVDCSTASVCAINCPTAQACQLKCPKGSNDCAIFGCQVGVGETSCATYDLKACNVTPNCT